MAAKVGGVEYLLKAMRPLSLQYQLPQSTLNFFSVYGLNVKYIGQQKKWTSYIFNFPIFHAEQIVFKIQINEQINSFGGFGQGKKMNIIMGVVDAAKLTNQRNYHFSGQAIWYDPQSNKQGALQLYAGNTI